MHYPEIMEPFTSSTAPYIKVFGPEHFFFLSVILVLVFIVVRYRHQLKSHERTLTKILLGFSLFQQILLYSWYAVFTGFDITKALPLHLCRISSLLGIYYLLSKKDTAMDLVFYYGLFAYASFIYPQAINAPYHLLGISYLINHAVTLLMPIIAWYAFGWRPKVGNLPLVIGIFLVYFAAAYVFNTLIGGNYFYLTERPFFKQWSELAYNSLAIVTTITGFLIGYGVLKIFGKLKT